MLPSEADGLASRPEAQNLVTIYAALADESADAVLSRFGGQGFGAFKPALAELAVETLRPIRDRFVALQDDMTATDAILVEGANRAAAIAKPTLDATYEALGLLR